VLTDDAVQLLEDLLLQIHILENSLDDHVDI
jgi:hypothetical protein